ncbi:hypothetical protein VW29_00710 [Devosia limi DSM 17137]|uniref:PRTase-CE domain-containing protein n=1 Tax=Devosia limi DSM 17137 TaxID=1121477 RepID=A0A0F5LXA5_9HYPH|nr:hypothetical protein [Devosia limi]KKB86809.1 hypothetical protein VW29_00710 [Devosia limi DSM 17137]SHF93832.1 hypothetical protein SAMN02745223_03935 [Devosia limi DSM 17137]
MSSTDQRQHLLFERETHFRNFQLWPLANKLDLRRWLGNFENAEQEFALRLANAFCYFSDDAVDALFRASVQRYFNVLASRKTLSATQPLHRLAFVPVEGETPNTTDSGHLFARRLKKKMGVPEARILYPANVIQSHSNYDTIIFVDDFVGSGNQMEETFRRSYEGQSFWELAHSRQMTFGYCACVFTEKGLNRLRTNLPMLDLSPAHVTGEDYNLSLPSSSFWSGLEPSAIEAFLRSASARAGFTREDHSEEDWRGFHGLGLGVGFSHGIPDANLALFWSQRNDWKPLVRW